MNIHKQRLFSLKGHVSTHRQLKTKERLVQHLALKTKQTNSYKKFKIFESERARNFTKIDPPRTQKF